MGRNLESFIIENYKKAMAEEKELMMGIVERFRSAGYQIWMDDFGSAYSSLNVLKEFSFAELPARAMIGHTVREIFPSMIRITASQHVRSFIPVIVLLPVWSCRSSASASIC